MRQVKQFNQRYERLKSDHSTFIPVYQELSDFVLAHRGRFLGESGETNKGYKRNTKQLNNHARLASRTLASGMMAGITSPARPWFRLGTSDPQLREAPGVREWLHAVQTIMYEVFAQSNTYNVLHQLYSELGTFGTAAMGVYKDYNDVIHCIHYTVGSYLLANNDRNEVDVFYRECELTIAQAVQRYGIENVSRHIKDQWEKNNTETRVTIRHAIEPNDDRLQGSPLAKDMPYRSVHWEKGGTCQKDNVFLRKSGFLRFPILAPRWDVVGEDVYSTDCPGMTALGDIKGLQLQERRSLQMLDRMSDPIMQGPSSIKQQYESASAGDVVWLPEGTRQKIEPIYTPNPDYGKLDDKISRTENRISRAFYEDLFLMLANTDRRQITAREIAEKHEEKLLMLGPVLERLHAELLDPLIDITFDILQREGVLPPPPPELRDIELRVEYISVLAQAQRMVAVGALDAMTMYTANLSAVFPEARHKFNAVEAMDEYAYALGVAPSVIRSDDEAEAAAAAEAQQIQGQQMMENMSQTAQAAKTASETQRTEDSALDGLMRNMGL